MYKSVIKFGVSALAMFGVDEIVGNAIKHVNPQTMSVAKKICVGVASMAISGCVVKAVNNYIDETIDEVFDAIEGFLTKDETTDEPEVEEVETEEV